MQIDSTTLTLVGFVGTWLSIAFGGGVIYGRISLKIKANSDDIVELNKRFFTENHEPVIMTYKAHDHICSRANETLSTELRFVREAISAHSQAVKTCGEQVSALTVAVAVLEEQVGK